MLTTCPKCERQQDGANGAYREECRWLAIAPETGKSRLLCESLYALTMMTAKRD